MKCTPSCDVRLSDGLFYDRFELNKKYVLSLKNENLLQNHYQEAGLQGRIISGVDGIHEETHWGWESPSCQLRGHFLGHWLSAAAKIWASSGDMEVKARADRVVAELGKCQRNNGGEWVGSIPEKYLFWIASQLPRHRVWAPHYTLHKTLMGLYDMHVLAGNEEALDVLSHAAEWFHKWTSQFSREQMDDILDVETGGMLETWANLYGVTGKAEHLDLIHKYDRPRLFERLLAGEDALTNMHANTTIPEAHGAARAYEVTGEERWRKIVEAYWDFAVNKRGTFCTGGQTTGEIWTPPLAYAARLGDKNQEHCTVYNMIRLADYLLRWTGKAEYSDYIEKNLYNGILAQQHAGNGMVAYFLPLAPGSRKSWGSPTRDFWCCHGTLVQAQASYAEWIWLYDEEGPVLSQYIPSETRWKTKDGVGVILKLGKSPDRGAPDQNASPAGHTHRPTWWAFDLEVRCDKPSRFTVKFRIPDWLVSDAKVALNGKSVEMNAQPGSFASMNVEWSQDRVQIILPKGLSVHRIPDAPEMVAFLDGPVVLAGLCEEERLLYTDSDHPETILASDNEREWGYWLPGYRVKRQERGLRFLPLYQITDEVYTVYFPTASNQAD